MLSNILNFFVDFDDNSLRYIVNAKREVVYNNKDISEFSKIPDVILNSWQTSIKMGISPKTAFPFVDCAKRYKAKDAVEKVMLDTFDELYKIHIPIQHIAVMVKPYFFLTNSHGIIIAEYGAPDDIKFYHNYNFGVNTNISLEAIGTTAHSIAMSEQKATQMLGQYSYLDFFEHIVMTSAPIVLNGESIGTIGVLTRGDLDFMQYDIIKRFNNLSTRAMTIENAIKMMFEHTSNELIRQTISQNTANIDNTHGVITIDENNNIAYICNLAKQIIAHNEDMNLAQYILNIEKVLNYVNFDENSKYANKHMLELSDKRKISAVIKKLNNASDGKHIGYTLFLQAPSKANTRYSLNSMIGEHPSLSQLKEQVDDIAQARHNVLILGESGTGKEMIAQAIHEASGVKGHFVAINCASIPANLIESELFGYVEGAFTGASKSGSMGKIEYANNGTLFLDEIGDMPLSLQPVLLRVLEERQVIRIGGKKSIPVNVRVIAATNVNLYDQVDKKEFRQDLYFRLSVINFYVPPLRERGRDVLLLANHFIMREQAICQHEVKLSKEVENLFLTYSWPGNIRQLENAVISALYMVKDSKTVNVEHLPRLITDGGAVHNASEKRMHETILQALEQCGDNYAKAARMLNISRPTLYKKLAKMGIK